MECRSRFTESDFDFVVEVLAREPSQSTTLSELLTDEDSRNSILDHDKLLRSLLQQGGWLKVSASFYFYVLTRHVLKWSGLEDREVADYTAGVLTHFCNREKLSSPYTGDTTGGLFPYLSDLLIALQKTSPSESFLLRLHIANFSLFLSGIFANRIHAHRDRRGGPDLEFYERIGRSHFALAAKDTLAKQLKITDVLEELSNEFRRVRKSLNHLSAELLQMERNPTPTLLWTSGSQPA